VTYNILCALLVKVDKIIEGNKIKVIELDIDNYGSVIPLRKLELKLPKDDSIIKALSSTEYAAILLKRILTESVKLLF